jgi:DNA primase
MMEHKANKGLTNIEDITKYINESLKDLLSIDDSILIDLTLKKISDEYRVEYDTLKKKYDELLKQETKTNKSEVPIVVAKPTKRSQYDIASRNLLYYMTRSEKVITEVEDKVAFFPDAKIRNLVNEIIYYYHKYGVFKIADFISYINDKEDENKLFIDILSMNKSDEYTNEEINDYISVINSYPVKNKVNDLNKKLHEESDPLKQADILKEILLLKGVK